VSHRFYRAPERDRERRGFVARDFALLQGYLTSRAGGGHTRSFAPDAVEVWRSSVWMETSD
jgi:hypothetical protein